MLLKYVICCLEAFVEVESIGDAEQGIESTY